MKTFISVLALAVCLSGIAIAQDTTKNRKTDRKTEQRNPNNNNSRIDGDAQDNRHDHKKDKRNKSSDHRTTDTSGMYDRTNRP